MAKHKFNVGDVVSLKETVDLIPKNVVGRVTDFCVSNSQYLYRVKTIALGTESEVYECDLQICDRHVCPECGLDYFDEDIAEHMELEHGFPPKITFKDLEDQAQDELQAIDDTLRFKADQYDLISDMMFMACGIVEDGDNVRYIIDPETVCDELLRIILNDKQMDRSKFIAKKRKYFDNGGSW